MKYIISDTHFNHWSEYEQRGIITFERDQFDNIREHDDYIVNVITKLSEKIKPDDEFWHLGDFGDLNYLWVMQLIKDTGAETHFILGNHDHQYDIINFAKYFDYVHEYPVYLSKKLVFSHEPVAAWDSVLNVHGHLHSSIIDKPNYINASIHVAGYKPITDKHISTAFSKMPKWTMRFLYEPYANDYKFIQNKPDVVMDRNGKIDLSASRLLMRLNKDDLHEYKGGL